MKFVQVLKTFKFCVHPFYLILIHYFFTFFSLINCFILNRTFVFLLKKYFLFFISLDHFSIGFYKFP